jgi:plastocyanin
MRQLSALASGLVLVLALATLGQADDKDGGGKKGKNHTVEMHDDYFKPKTITISVGDTITWVNKGKKTHTATSDDEGKTFDTESVKKGQKSKPVTFKKAGKVPYHCEPHEEKMKGTITVKEAKKD